MTGRRLAASAAAVVAAALLVALALDALRWERRLGGDDLRFRASPPSVSLWRADALLPFAATQRLIGVRDDVEYRQTLRRFWPVRPGQAIVGPELEALRGQVQAELARIPTAARDRRSHALNLLGVLTVGRYYGTYYGIAGSGPLDPAERASVLRAAIGLFQSAIESDPRNADAKVNLELLLRDPEAAEFLVDTPGGQAAEGQSTGAGRGGTGY